MFYTDCVHEIKPVLEGYRVTLSYNLYYEGNNIPILPESEVLKSFDNIYSLHNEIFKLRFSSNLEDEMLNLIISIVQNSQQYFDTLLHTTSIQTSKFLFENYDKTKD
jgi:hypothetical protein